MKKKIVAAGGLVQNENEELLMIYRRGKWDLPKGKLDEGETTEACAVREVQEETGLKKIKMGKLIGITYHEYFDIYSLGNVIKETYWYEMKIKGRTRLIPQTEEDISEIKWISKNELSHYLKNSFKNIEEIITKAGLLKNSV
jgi:8-oxo-dGTP pyrophosphatase MutT (NUDIX family)